MHYYCCTPASYRQLADTKLPLDYIIPSLSVIFVFNNTSHFTIHLILKIKIGKEVME